ncbi:MAG: hypothetical protein ABSF22_21625, partial [Bryobacteraceae bacterium]
MGAAVLLLMLAFEDPPKDVIDFFRSVAATLADAGRDVNTKERIKPRDAGEFLDHFDKEMPGYAEFSGQIQEMTGAGEVSTTIDFINTEGDGRKRTLDLDWLLLCEGERPKRAVIKCTIEKRGRISAWIVDDTGFSK